MEHMMKIGQKFDTIWKIQELQMNYYQSMYQK